jgi:hypothetical protein
VSLGTSVDATLAAIECARTVIAVVNPHVPRAWGDAMIPMDMIDIFVEGNSPLEPAHFSAPNEVETAIGKYCAELVDDGACLQMGIGAIPNAVLAQLGNHKNLGVHTEMFADGTLDLVEKGVINCSNKVTDRGKLVSTFLMGSQRVYDFIDDNPMVAMMDVGYTNDPFVIAKNPKMTAINSALQIDLTGQVSLIPDFHAPQEFPGMADLLFQRNQLGGIGGNIAQDACHGLAHLGHPVVHSLVRHSLDRLQAVVQEMGIHLCLQSQHPGLHFLILQFQHPGHMVGKRCLPG